MSEPDGRSWSGAGSTAFDSAAATSRPLPGQPAADQPTDVLSPLPDHPAASTWTHGRHEDRTQQWDDDRDDDPDDDGDEDRWPATRPEYQDAPVAVRRADTLAGLLLLLAGIAAGVSLLVVWWHGGRTGLQLVGAGIDDARQGTDRLLDTGSWQAPAVVGGGAVLFVLGLLLFTPARTHRFLGALALVVCLVVAAGVLVPLADARWQLSGAAVGFWFAVAVGVLGALGALKALTTGPKLR